MQNDSKTAAASHDELLQFARNDAECGSEPHEIIRALVREGHDAAAVYLAITQMIDESKAAVSGRIKSMAESKPAFDPHPLAFDFNEEEPEADWIIDRILARKEVGLLSGDTGAAKSILAKWLVVQALEEGYWLNWRTNILRATVIDEENTQSLIKTRLRAMGMQNDAAPQLRYYSRPGGSIGDKGMTDEWLDSHLVEFRPDLLVIDTLLAATAGGETNSNDHAAAMMKVFRNLAEQHDCAIVLAHHERKQSKDMPSSASQATLGARAWVGQSDAHMTLTVETDYDEELVAAGCGEDDKNVLTRRTFKLRAGEKQRSGGMNHPLRIGVTSEKRPNGTFNWLFVANEGPIEGGQSKAGTMARAAASVVQSAEGTMTTGEIAGAMNTSAQDPTFKRGLSEAVESGYLLKPKRGMYDFGTLGSLDA